MSDERAGGAVSWSDGALGSGEERPLSDGRVGEAVAAAAADQGLEALQVDVVFVSAAELAEMHGTFLDDPTETDVITFDLRDPDLVDAPGPDEELYVSQSGAGEGGCEACSWAGLCNTWSTARFTSAASTIRRGDRSSMRAAEGRIMERLGFAPDGGAHEAYT